jgi:BMFP domain-containing protein YqiC
VKTWHSALLARGLLVHGWGRLNGRPKLKNLGVIVETEVISKLAQKLARAVPGSGGDLDVMRADLERNFRGLLSGAFERMDLVTREEFDVQRRVLERSREKLAKLEAQVAALEQQRN